MKKKILPYTLILFLTLFCFWIHFSDKTNSMLNDFNRVVSNEYLTSVVDLHQSHPAFQKRPLTTFLIKKTALHTNISIGAAFIAINFLFLFISGVLIFQLSLLFEKNNKLALGNVIIYFTSFAILFAFFPPIYTYDEPIQFCLLLLGLISIYKKKWWGYFTFFSLSLIARESSLILLPGLLVIILNYKNGIFNLKALLKKDNLLQFAYLVVPIVVYLIFLNIFLNQRNIAEESKSDFLDRFSHFYLNMKNQEHAFESLISFLLVLGIPLYLLFNSVNKKNESWTKYSKYLRAFLITVIINSVIVILTTKAREARLFIIPMFFIWPIFTKLFYEDIKLLFSIKHYRSTFSNLNSVAFFIFLMFLNYILSFKVYKPTIGNHNENYFNEYLFVTIFLILTHATLKNNINTSSNKT
jgi:hypothetical protein